MKSFASLRGGRDGFALPLAIIVIGFLSAGVMGAYARSTSETRTIDNQRAQQQAFAAAAAGLERAFADGISDAAAYTIQGASVEVVATDMGQRTYVVRSTATMQPGPGRPAARRTVAQVATRTTATVDVDAAWTSLSGLTKNGSSGRIDGNDYASPPCGDGTPKPGVAVPTGEYDQNGSGTVVYGDPAVKNMGTQQQMAGQVNINWAGLTNPLSPAITPAVIYCASGYGYSSSWKPCGAWPTAEKFADPKYWPTIVINGTSKLPSNGKGTLIVTGDLDLNGGDQWRGIIMVGGRITDNGSGHIAGAVITGLNVLLGHTVDKSSKANGTKEYLYNSCDIADAAGGWSLVPIDNAWADNWSW